ncbi:MAG: hypothetical protein ACRCX2_31920 [Paraclostridium sp.]
MKIRTVKVVINKYDGQDLGIYTFRHPDSRIDFQVRQIDSEEPDSGYIKIYGVSRETYSIFKIPEKSDYTNGHTVDVYYGYDYNDVLVYSGKVTRVIYDFSSGDQTLTLLIDKDTKKANNMVKSISTDGKVSLGQAFTIFRDEYGYDFLYENSISTSISVGRISLTGSITDAMKSILSKDYSYYIDDKKIYVYNKSKATTKEVMMFPGNGLLEYPSEDTKNEKFRIKTTLIPEVESGMVVKIPVDKYWYSNKDTGNYRKFTVGNYTSSFSKGLGTTELECTEE